MAATDRLEAGKDGAAPHGSAHIIATAKGGGFLAAGTLFEYAARFLIGLLLARSLGLTGYGLYVLAISVSTLFAGISLIGTDDAMVRYVAILSSRRDREGVGGTLQVGLGMALAGGITMGIALFILAGPIATGLFSAPDLARVLRFMAVVVPFLALSNTLLGIARGFKRMDYTAFSQNGVQSVVRLILVGVLAMGGWLTLMPAAIAFGISDVAASLALIVLVNREFDLRSVLRPGSRRDLRQIFGFAFPLWVSGLLRQFRVNIQNVLVGSLGSVAGVGVLSVANRVNDVATLGSKSVYIASRPLMAQLHDRGDRDALRGLYTATTRWSLAVNIPLFLGMVLYPGPLLQVFGEDYARGATALVLVACAQMIAAGTGTCQGMLDMTGHTRVKLANTVAWTVLLIGGGVFAIPRWGVVGAAASTLLAMGVVNIASVLEVWFLERLQPYDRSSVKPLAAGALTAVGGIVLRAVLPVEGLIGALAQGAVLTAAYLGLLLAMGLEPQDRIIVDRVMGKVRGVRGRVVHAGAGGTA